MPRAPPSKQEKAASKANNSVVETFEGENAEIPDSPHSSITEDAATAKGSKKRNHPEEEQGDFGNEMQKMLECFGADISKTLSNKRKRLEQFTQSSLKTSNRKVDDIWKNQQGERQKLTDEFSRQITGVFQQWDTDLEKSKEQEEKLLNLFRQQQKFFQQTRIALGQRLKTVKQLQDQYLKAMENLEKCHTDQHGNVQVELKKEMQLLQKKILMDTQQQEMANVRKSLQTMLF